MICVEVNEAGPTSVINGIVKRRKICQKNPESRRVRMGQDPEKGR